MLNPWLGIALVLTALGAALAALHTWQVHHRPAPEKVRKGLHAAMSAVVLTLPWLFAETWPVGVLAALALGAMGALRVVRALRDGAGRVLHDVGRQSVGELCFPVAVGALFVVTGGDPLLYGVPVGVLGLADPAAALVGKRFGQARFGARPGAKTVEGSLAFFAVATCVVWGALALASSSLNGEALSGDAALLVGLFVGVGATLAEVVAWRGLDNLFVPLVTLATLDAALGMEAAALSRSLTTLTSSGAVALGLGCTEIGVLYECKMKPFGWRYRLG